MYPYRYPTIYLIKHVRACVRTSVFARPRMIYFRLVVCAEEGEAILYTLYRYLYLYISQYIYIYIWVPVWVREGYERLRKAADGVYFRLVCGAGEVEGIRYDSYLYLCLYLSLNIYICVPACVRASSQAHGWSLFPSRRRWIGGKGCLHAPSRAPCSWRKKLRLPSQLCPVKDNKHQQVTRTRTHQHNTKGEGWEGSASKACMCV